MRICGGYLKQGKILIRIYHGIVSRGTILHAYLPWYHFPGDNFACVSTVVSFPGGHFSMRIYRGTLSLGPILLRTYHGNLSRGSILNAY